MHRQIRHLARTSKRCVYAGLLRFVRKLPKLAFQRRARANAARGRGIVRRMSGAETVDVILRALSLIHIFMRELTQRNILSPTGKATWSRRAIDTLLSNEKYRGNSTASTARMSGDTHSKPRDKYLYQGHHEAIVDEKTFIAVAEEKKQYRIG